ncbi:hypothetical protein UYSO10_2294 [Kosakonia radicincitans]|nr:hypothetical protein UYSO10_2294 [Kosakonia radicincitans]
MQWPIEDLQIELTVVIINIFKLPISYKIIMLNSDIYKIKIFSI